MRGFLDGYMNNVIFRTLVSIATIAIVSGSMTAQAQQPKPRPLETALVGPGTIAVPGIGTVEGVLSAADAARYKRIFEHQEAGQWRAAEAIIKRIQDKRLMGHALALKYLHPTAYRSRFTELRDWLKSHADHPQARRIHRLAVLRQPKGASAPVAPIVYRAPAKGAAVRKSSEGRPLYDRAASRAGRSAHSEILRRVSRGWPTGAREIIKSTRAVQNMGPVQMAQAWRAITQAYFRAGKDTEALEAAMASHAASPGDAPLAYWWGGLAAWRLGQMDDAETLFGELSRAERASDSLGAAGSFWAARAALANNNPESVTSYLETGAQHTRTFYGQLSRRAIGNSESFGWRKPALGLSAFRDIAGTKIGARAIALLQIGRDHDAERELLSLSAAHPALRNDVLALASHAGLPSVAYRLSGFAPPETRLAAAYPVPSWEPESGYSIDRALVLSFVRQESAFNRRAESRAGARGLMQLMPRTASYVGRESYLHGRGKYRLYEPDLNLELGQRYIQHLLGQKSVSGDLFRLAAAYNAGPGNLRSWERAVEHGDDPLLFIESLPSRETRKFVEQIMTNLWIYRSQLGQEAPSLDDVVAGRWPQYHHQDSHVGR
jgi:soluble lytic murein transglycosylase-like protein